jgi:hypothetical protein
MPSHFSLVAEVYALQSGEVNRTGMIVQANRLNDQAVRRRTVSR